MLQFVFLGARLNCLRAQTVVQAGYVCLVGGCLLLRFARAVAFVPGVIEAAQLRL